jgi:hypothetical protein
MSTFFSLRLRDFFNRFATHNPVSRPISRHDAPDARRSAILSASATAGGRPIHLPFVLRADSSPEAMQLSFRIKPDFFDKLLSLDFDLRSGTEETEQTMQHDKVLKNQYRSFNCSSREKGF